MQAYECSDVLPCPQADGQSSWGGAGPRICDIIAFLTNVQLISSRFRAYADIIPSLPVFSRFRNASGEGRAGSDCCLFHSVLHRPCKAGCICSICPSLASSPLRCPFPSPVQQERWFQPYLPISVVHFVPALSSSTSSSSPCAAWQSPFSLPTEDAVRVREPGIQQQSLSQWD